MASITWYIGVIPEPPAIIPISFFSLGLYSNFLKGP